MDQQPQVPPAAEVDITSARGRPGPITLAGGILIAIGGFTGMIGGALSVLAILALNPVGLPPWVDLPPGEFSTVAVALGLIGFGIVQVVSGVGVLRGSSWAWVAGIVLASIGALLAALGLLRGFGESATGVTTIFLPVVAANLYAVWALAAHPAWFTRR